MRLVTSSLIVVFIISFDFFSMGFVMHLPALWQQFGWFYIGNRRLTENWLLFIFNPSTYFSPTKHFTSRLWLSQVLPEQVITTSCWWVQLCFPHPSCLQSQRADSFPRQETWSIQMRPEPAQELVHPVALTAVGHPSCLQITETSSMPQPLLHTVPHSSWTFTSNLPVHLSSPSLSLSPFSSPPATMRKDSHLSGSKEHVENYHS